MDNENITQEAVEQYEQLRQLGPVNMLDINGVVNYAEMLELDDLAELAGNQKNYADLLTNFSHYMSLYDVEQPV